MYNETLGKLHFWLMTPAFWVMSVGQMTVGTMGMRRRIVDYEPMLGGMVNDNLSRLEVVHIVITICGLCDCLWHFDHDLQSFP